jgi:hypothetical protein
MYSIIWYTGNTLHNPSATDYAGINQHDKSGQDLDPTATKAPVSLMGT